MKQLLLTGALLLSAATASWAAQIRIEVDGQFQSATITPNSISVTCGPGGCCAVITINASAQMPQVGDGVILQQTDRVPENVVHQWRGEYLNHRVNKTPAGSNATLDFLGQHKQDF